MLILAPFGKKALTLTLHGITTTDKDIGVDCIRAAMFPVMEKFGIMRQELRIVKRGSSPDGGGEVVLHMPHLVLQPNTIHALNPNKITRIRGVAYSTRISPASVNRIVDAARDVLKDTLVDTFIYSDAARGDEAGKSPGFGVTIVAETKAGWPIVAEGVGTKGSVPEDLGRDVASGHNGNYIYGVGKGRHWSSFTWKGYNHSKDCTAAAIYQGFLEPRSHAQRGE
jgi:RNA 3'-terminal phosphate cyclase-like protein